MRFLLVAAAIILNRFYSVRNVNALIWQWYLPCEELNILFSSVLSSILTKSQQSNATGFMHRIPDHVHWGSCNLWHLWRLGNILPQDQPNTWWKLMYSFKNTRNIKFYTFPPCSLMPEIPSSQLKALVLPWNANIPGNITASPFLLRQGRGMARTRTPCSQEVGCPRLLWGACPQTWGHSRQLHFLHNFPKGHECTCYQVCIVGT